jgi:hypothetical protein
MGPLVVPALSLLTYTRKIKLDLTLDVLTMIHIWIGLIFMLLRGNT